MNELEVGMTVRVPDGDVGVITQISGDCIDVMFPDEETEYATLSVICAYHPEELEIVNDD